jgi:hypothetical protein
MLFAGMTIVANEGKLCFPARGMFADQDDRRSIPNQPNAMAVPSLEITFRVLVLLVFSLVIRLAT